MIDLERLKSVLAYDPATGVFTWKVRPRQRACSPIAGTVNSNGYRQICVDQKIYKAHRLAWFYVFGKWPQERHIDHINGFRDDNRIANLREADWSQNQANSKRRVTNRCGYKGVHLHKASGLWVARVEKDYKIVYAKYFKTAQEAHSAYCAAAREFFGDFARAE